MDSKILLENGTNELEVLEFLLDGNSYGINVAKIREIIPYQNVTPVPNAHPSVEGIFMPRDVMITAIDLKNCLQRGESEEKGLFIVTNFNKLDIAFHVDAVVGIHRVSWKDIITPNKTITNSEEGISTGVIKLKEKLVIILDFEKIVTYINPETGLQMHDIAAMGKRERNETPILIAEDSALLNKLIVDCLVEAGYVNIKNNRNGQEAWDMILKYKKEGSIKENVQCVITDIEMPLMDGHRLIKLIREDDELENVPVIIFSSLVNDEMIKKGEALGASVQLSKPEIGKLIQAIDRLVAKI